jgi:S1-C subfamily serine protease
MKKCIKCGRSLDDEDIFCTVCGTKQDAAAAALDPNNTLVMKYSGYLDNEALFKIAWAKEKGLVKSDAPNEAEAIYQMLALRGHLESMYRYAMLLLSKMPPESDKAQQWLNIAARQGHIASRNYLETMFGVASDAYHYQAPEFTQNVGGNANVARPTHIDPSGEVYSGAEISAQMKNSVVEVLATDGKGVACSSGLVVSSNGFVVTNAHAVLDAGGRLFETIHVRLNGREYEALPVAVGQPANGKNDVIDIALLYVRDFKDGVPALIGNSAACENGQKVYLIGNSLGDGICITSGIISDAKRRVSGLSYPYIMTDAAANHGNSGGPLMNEHGEVIGVLVAGVDNAEGMNFAIPTNMVRSFLAYVLKQSRLPQEHCGELSSLLNETTNMAVNWNKVFTGVKLMVEVVAFIVGLFV